MNLALFIFLFWSYINIYKFSKCGMDEKCNVGKARMINVHIIAHTHDDAGWLKNIHEYYVGSKKHIDRANVQVIINSVMKSLERDGSRKFSYVESVYIFMWLHDPHRTPLDVQRLVSLVKNGQLEIVSGGWVMNDEACTHYNDIINQMTIGFELMNDLFGSCGRPTTGWQVDPFGHSAAQASLLSRMGFDGLFFGRISDNVKYQKQSNLSAEFIWSPISEGPKDPTLMGESDAEEEMAKNRNDIFVSILPNLYQPPQGFCFDIFCSDDPIDDDPDSSTYNVGGRSENFMALMEAQSRYYATNHMIVTMGNDFHYQDAEKWYRNLDKLIAYINDKRRLNGSDIAFNLFYSTPGCYLHALRTSAVKNPFNLKPFPNSTPPIQEGDLNPPNNRWSLTQRWPGIEGGDFFPLVSYIHTWTGYYTSRPSLKYMIRESSRLLQVCKQIQVLAGIKNDGENDVKELERAVALAQHHDGITGTAKQAVTYDYVERMANGYPGCYNIIENGLKKLKILDALENLHFCPLLNISVCGITQNFPEIDVLLYNPQPWAVNHHYVTLPIARDDILITTTNGSKVPFQITKIPASVLRIPERYLDAENRSDPMDLSVTFETNLVALGSARYKIRLIDKTSQEKLEKMKIEKRPSDEYFIQNEYLRLDFDPDTKLMSRLTNKASGQVINLNQSFLYYGASGSFSSGAYVFRTQSMPPTSLFNMENGTKLEIIKGPLFEKARQIGVHGDWIDQEITLFAGLQWVEVTWTIGPIPIGWPAQPKDVITRYTSDLESRDTWYVDSNGRFSVRRHHDTKPDPSKSDPAENYYPATTKIFIRDENVRENGGVRQLAIVIDRAQGVSSLENGSLELMLHRRLFYDDGLGVNEALNETGSDGNGLIVGGRHWLIFDAPRKCNELATSLAQKTYLQPQIMFLNPLLMNRDLNYMQAEVRENVKSHMSKTSFLNRELPPNVQLLSLVLRNETILLRLEHIYSPGEHPVLSRPEIIDLKDLFKTFDIMAVEELALGGDRLLKDTQRYDWVTSKWTDRKSDDPDQDSLKIKLYPLDIRTFNVHFEIKNV